MKKLLFLTSVLFISLVSASSFAEVLRAKIIDSGEIVFLHPDGTWKYDETFEETQRNSDIPDRREFNHPPFSEEFGNDFHFKQEYDKFDNETTVLLTLDLEPSKVSYSLERLVFFSYFSYLGREVETPIVVMIGFSSFSEDWEYLTSRKLTFLVDDKPLEIGSLDHDGRVGSGYLFETLSQLIPLSQFLRIVNAKNVEGKLFTTEFKFTEEQLEALRDYASRMK